MMELSRDPAWRLDNVHDMSKDEIRESTMRKFSSIVHYVTSEKLADFQKRMAVISYTDSAFWTRFGVHYFGYLHSERCTTELIQFSYTGLVRRSIPPQ